MMQLVLIEGNELPEGWLLTGLGEFRNGKSESFNPKNEAERKLELYSVPSHATGHPESIPCSEIGSNKQYVATGDVLISKINPRLNRTWVVGDFTANDKIASTEWVVFKKHPAISSTFLKYLLESYEVRNFLAQNASGVGGSLTRVKPTIFDSIQVALPPANEQTRIVEKIEELFSELDKGVESLKTAQQQIKVYRQALLKQAFEGKLTEQWRADNPDKVESAEQLLERIKTEREARHHQQLEEWKQAVKEWEVAGKEGKRPTKPRKLKAPEEVNDLERTNLPLLPVGWEWVRLGHLTWSVKDGPHFSPKYSDTGIPFISGGNVRPHGVDFENVKYISEELHEEFCKRCKPELGDILYTKGGTTGIARVNTYDREFSVWVHVAVLKTVESITPFYLQHALNTPSCYAQSQKYTHGVGNQDLGLTRMVNIILPICSEHEQTQIIEQVEYNLSVINEIENTIEINLKKSEALRQSILKKAFSGQLVSQNPDDEPASELLARIREEREAAELAAKEAKKAAKKTAPKRTRKTKASAA